MFVVLLLSLLNLGFIFIFWYSIKYLRNINWEVLPLAKFGKTLLTAEFLTVENTLLVFYFFFLYWSPSSFLCMVFDFISSNIDEVLSINPSANVFVFEDFNVHHKDWLTYSGGTDIPCELCYSFRWPYSDN